jgi:hypothetical protein
MSTEGLGVLREKETSQVRSVLLLSGVPTAVSEVKAARRWEGVMMRCDDCIEMSPFVFLCCLRDDSS